MAALKVRSAAATIGAFAEERARDICEGGIFIETRAPHEVDTIVKVLIELEGGEVAVSGMGRVAWRRTPAQAGPYGVPGMGIQFTQLDKTSEERLAQIVAEHADAGSRFAQQAAAVLQDEERAQQLALEASNSVPLEPSAPPGNADAAPISLAAEFMARDAPPPSVRRAKPARPAATSSSVEPANRLRVAIAVACAVVSLGVAAASFGPMFLTSDEERISEALVLHRKVIDARIPAAARETNRRAYEAFVAKLSDKAKSEVELRSQQEFEARREAGLRQFFALAPEKQQKFLDTFEARRDKAAKEEGIPFRSFGETAPNQTPEQRRLDERFSEMLKAKRTAAPR